MKKLLLNTLFFAVIILPALAQEDYLVENFCLTENKLDFINCIYQSQDGVLWFGTADGLAYYDGYTFTNFPFQKGKNSYQGRFVNSIAEDKQHNLYIATQDGIVIWKRKKDKFALLQHSIDNPNTISDNNVLQILYHQNTIWALTERSLNKIVGDTVERYNFYIDNHTMRDATNKLSLKIDNENNVWIATKDGVEIFNPQTKSFYRLYDNGDNAISNKRIRDIFIQDNNKVWIATFGNLNIYSLRSKKMTNYSYRENNEENTLTVNKILIDSVIFLGTNHGLKTFKKGKIVDFKSAAINSITDRITDIYKDKTGFIWVATANKGLYKINSINKNSNLLPKDYCESNLLSCLTNKNKHEINIFSRLHNKDRHSIIISRLNIHNKSQNRIVYLPSNSRIYTFKHKAIIRIHFSTSEFSTPTNKQ